jgi:hypothetical protein
VSRHTVWAGLFLGALTVFSLAQAQNTQGGGGGAGQSSEDRGRRGRGEGRRFDFSAFRERQMSSIREDMGATEEQWKTLQPKIEKVMTLQRDVRGGFGGRRGGRDAGDTPESKVQQAQRDLYTAVQEKSTSDDDLTQKLAAYREAREKARTELASAQKELKTSLTPRQEAVLVINGLID